MKILYLVPLLLIFLIPSAYAELDLSNQKLISLDGKLNIEFSENLQTFHGGRYDEVPHLDFGIIELKDKTVLLDGEYTNILADSFSIRLGDGKVYAKNNQDGTFTVKVLTVNDNGFEKQTFASVLQPRAIVEPSKDIPPAEKTETPLVSEMIEEKYIPDLKMIVEHDFKTYWKDTFDIEIKTYDGNKNNNIKLYPNQGKQDGVNVDVILSLDGNKVATLNGVTQYGNWKGSQYFVENMSTPGEYTVDVIASYLGKTVSDTSSMFVIGIPIDDGSAANTSPIANAGPDQLLVGHPNNILLDGSASSDSDGSIISYSWIQLSGPSVAINNADTATPDFDTVGAGDTYVFELTVTDNDNIISKDTVKVTT